MSEKAIEGYLVKKVMEIGGLSWKFSSTSQNGVPDRIVIMPNGRIAFVELKSSQGRLSVIQEHVLVKLKKMNCEVHIIKSRTGVSKLISSLTIDDYFDPKLRRDQIDHRDQEFRKLMERLNNAEI